MGLHGSSYNFFQLGHHRSLSLTVSDVTLSLLPLDELCGDDLELITVRGTGALRYWTLGRCCVSACGGIGVLELAGPAVSRPPPPRVEEGLRCASWSRFMMSPEPVTHFPHCCPQAGVITPHFSRLLVPGGS